MFWDSIKDSDNAAAFHEYLKQFPVGTFAGLARLKITELERKQAALAVPPKQPAPKLATPAVGIFPKKLKPGDSFKDCDECPEVVVIPAGTFVMGSPSSEEHREFEEGPRRRVSVGSFALGKHEVMREAYATFARETGRSDGDGCSIYDGSKCESDPISLDTELA